MKQTIPLESKDSEWTTPNTGKRISSSADMVETAIFDQMSVHCDPELEDSIPIFLHDILAPDVA